MNKRWTGVARLLDRVTRETDARDDTELLEAFLRHDDAEAFARLVRRHGPMVQGVCRRVLGVAHAHDVDDAFQATFLVLLRKAPSLQWRDRLAPWLHGVAQRTALKARSRRARNQAVERPTNTMTHEPMTHEAPPRPDGIDCLDEELLALPDKYRQPLVLCELQGLSRREAARALKLPEGTLSSRLARGRQLLRRRLVRRGITLSAAGLLTLLAQEAKADVALSLLGDTVRIAHVAKQGSIVSGASASVLSLTEGVVKSMFLTKLKTLAVVALLLVTLAGFATGTLATAWGEDDVAQATPPKPVTPPTVAETRPSPEPSPRSEECFLFRISVFQREKGGERRSLAEPNIIALSGHRADFHAGGEVPAEQITDSGKKVEFIPFGIRLSLAAVRVDDERVCFQFESSWDESEKADGFDYRIVGTHARCMKKVRLGEKDTIVLRKNDDGSSALWVEAQVEKAPAHFVGANPEVRPAPTAVAPQRAFREAGQELPNPVTPPLLPASGPIPLAYDARRPVQPMVEPSAPTMPVAIKQYLIEAKIQEAATPGDPPETLSMPRITTLEGQVATIEVGNATQGTLSLQTDVRAVDVGQVQLHLRFSNLKRDKADGQDVRQVGTAADIKTKVYLYNTAKVILTLHPDGSPRLWAEMTVKEAQPVTLPAPSTPVSTGAPMLPVLPPAQQSQTVAAPTPSQPVTLPPPIAPVSTAPPVLRDIPIVSQLFSQQKPGRQFKLRHRSTSEGPRIELVVDNVRLEATKLTMGADQGQHLFHATPNGIFVEGPDMKMICTDLVLNADRTVNEEPFTTKKGKLIIVHDGKVTPALAHVTWGDARIECTKLEIAKDLALTVNADGLQFIRGDAVVRGAALELDFGSNQLKVNGAASVQPAARP